MVCAVKVKSSDGQGFTVSRRSVMSVEKFLASGIIMKPRLTCKGTLETSEAGLVA